MKYRLMLMIIRLLRVFVADFHAFVMYWCAGNKSNYKIDFEESWKDSEKFWDELNEEDFDE